MKKLNEEPEAFARVERRQVMRGVVGTLGAVLGAGALAGCASGAGARESTAIAALNGPNVLWFDTIANLQAYPAASLENGQAAVVAGYAVSGDGGGGVFYWDVTPAMDDGGTIIVTAGAPVGPCWRRVFDGPIDVRWFGVKSGPTDVSDNATRLGKAVAATKALATSGGAPRGATLYFPSGQYLTNQPINFDCTYGIRIEGCSSVAGDGSAATAAILFTQGGDANSVMVSALGAYNFQMCRLDIQYSDPTFQGHLVSNAALDLCSWGASNAAYAVFENCNFTGSPAAFGAASLLNLSGTINMIVRGCTFRFAKVGIVGDDGTPGIGGAYVVSIEDSAFLHLELAAIKNPADNWLVKTCTFEYAAMIPGPFENQAIGIVTDPGKGGRLTVLNSWFGDGAGGRPWIEFSGFVLNVIGCTLSFQNADHSLVRIQPGGTVANVNLQGNIFISGPEGGAYVIQIPEGCGVTNLCAIGNAMNGGTAVLTDADKSRVIGSCTIMAMGVDSVATVANAHFDKGIRTFDNPVNDGVPQDAVAASGFYPNEWNVGPAKSKVVAYRYALCGKQMTVELYVSESAIAAQVGYLEVDIPLQKLGVNTLTVGHFEWTYDGAAWNVGTFNLQDGRLRLYRADRVAWDPTALLTLSGTATFLVA